MPSANKIGSIFVAWLLVATLVIIGSATIGQGPGTIYGGPGQVITPDMTDYAATDLTAPIKVRFGPFTRTDANFDEFEMTWSSTEGLAKIVISGCYDMAQIVLNGKIIFDSTPDQGSRKDTVSAYVKDFNTIDLTLRGGCLGGNVYITIQPVVQLCPDCGDMATRDITVVGGFLTGYYYYLPTDHPDVGTGPIADDVPGDHNWWDDRFFAKKELWEVPKWSTLPPPIPPVTPPPHWDGDDQDTGCANALRFKQTIYAPLTDTYTIEVGPFGDTWVYIDGVQVYDSDNADLGKRGMAYGEIEITQGFHRIDIYHAYRENACDPVESQFAFNFVPNVSADVEDDEYFTVELYGDDAWEDVCFLNIW